MRVGFCIHTFKEGRKRKAECVSALQLEQGKQNPFNKMLYDSRTIFTAQQPNMWLMQFKSSISMQHFYQNWTPCQKHSVTHLSRAPNIRGEQHDSHRRNIGSNTERPITKIKLTIKTERQEYKHGKILEKTKQNRHFCWDNSPHSIFSYHVCHNVHHIIYSSYPNIL